MTRRLRVLAVSADWAPPPPGRDDIGPTPGGCYWYRLHVPLSALATQGLIEWVGVGDIAAAPSGEILAQKWDRTIEGGWDVVIIQRWMHADAEEVIRNARRAGQIVIQDIDDLFLDLSPHNDAFWHTHPNPEKALEKYRRKAASGDRDAARIVNRIAPRIHELSRTDHRYRQSDRRHYLRTLRASDAVWVSTPYLAKRYRPINPNVTVLRNAIDLERWEPYRRLHDDKIAELEEHGPTRLGWHGSTAHRSGDWESMRGILGPWLERHPDWTLSHLGHHPHHVPLPDLAGVPRSRVDLAPAIPVMRVPEIVWGFTAGIVPLAHTAFNHAKSCLKAMEMAAAGVPAVCASSDEYHWWGVGVVPNNSKHLWWTALDRMLTAEGRAERVAEQDERLAELTIDACWPTWADALDGAVNRPVPNRTRTKRGA